MPDICERWRGSQGTVTVAKDLDKQECHSGDVIVDNLDGISMASCRTPIQCESYRRAQLRLLGKNICSLIRTL